MTVSDVAAEYPPQEPLSEAGQQYAAECLRRGEGVACEEAAYGDDPYQRLSIVRAARPDGRVLVFWHGGGWTSGYREWMHFNAPAFTAAGVTFVAPGYRLAPKHLFPTGYEDCMRALAWVHRNIAAYGGDPARIFVGGHSAGGHYAALLAARRDWPARVDLPHDVVKGALPVSGTYWFGADSGLSMRPRFLGPDTPDSTAERDASPLRNIEPPLPPMLLFHGEADFPHLAKQAEAFESAVRAADGEIGRVVMPGRNHFSAHYACGEPDGPMVRDALAFMKRHA
jgi:acetyl esterase/lipase